MSAIQTTPAQVPQLLPAGVRIGSGLAVAVFVAATWMAAAGQSREAVQLSAVAMASQPVHVTLQPVEIVARRTPASETALAGSPSVADAL